VKDKRIISIKDSKLRRIRNEMREVLNCFLEAEWKNAFNNQKRFLYNIDGKRRTIDDMSSEELQHFRMLQQKQNEIRKIGDHSICTCYTCGKPDQDMYYNHPYRAWFCVECANLAKSHHTRIKEKKRHGEYTCDSDDEFSKTFLS